ncbi:MAG: hypothetical protein IKM09_03655 [Clostridia bacterium]|nr:hypothetical protein [Clostridia bacterium]
MITGKQDLICGLLGKTLKHSLSPAIHSLLCDYSYSLFEVGENGLAEFLCGDFDGINVTIPYKKDVIKYLDFISPEAEAIGAVNTVKKKNGKLYGYNTDIYGFEKTLERARISLEGKKVLILGTGGAAQTVLYAAKKQNANAIFVSRSGDVNYKNVLSLHADADIIVNTTPVGMFPDNLSSPLSLEGFDKLSAVIDLVYNPLKTAILLDAEARGVKAVSCIDMLFYQALRACEIFTDTTIDKADCEQLLSRFIADKTNIVLVGMPGSGKSTVGEIIAKTLSREFIDCDAEIEKKHGMSCAEIIENHGEKRFRELESEVIREVGALTGAVIATGGGAVTVCENKDALRQNARIYFLNRDINALPTDNRPLSKKCGVAELYKKRLPLYLDFADFTVEVTDAESTAKAVIKEHYNENTCN